MAIKPLDVPGPKLTEGHNGETAVDFVLADFETFFTGDLDEYAAFTDGSGRSLFPSFAVDVAVASCSGTSSRGLLLSFVRKGSSNPVVILTTPNSRHHRFEPNGSRPIFQCGVENYLSLSGIKRGCGRRVRRRFGARAEVSGRRCRTTCREA